LGTSGKRRDYGGNPLIRSEPLNPKEGALVKHLWIIVFLFTFDVLCAQERSDTALYIFPATGGTQEEREFFDKHIQGEIAGANYGIVYTPQEANYTVNLNIGEYEDEETPDVVAKQLTLVVVRTADDHPVVEFSWSYHELEEMYQWNLYIVYNALANVTLKKPEPEIPEPVPEAPKRRDFWLYLGLRAGGSVSGYSFQATPGYEAGFGGGFGGEGGLVAELRLFPFFGLQLEALFSYDTFNAIKMIPRDDSWMASPGTFTTISFMFPLMLKFPIGFDKCVLSFYTGAYYLFSPQREEESGDGGGIGGFINNFIDGLSDSFSMSFPLGFIIGADLGIPLGPGELFIDLRYGRNLDMTVIQNGPRYDRDRISVGLGYKFGFFKKREQVTINN
jgi:hypothetical protein